MNTFFITGEQRSGTTLLSAILGRHSEVHLDGNSLGFRLVSCFSTFPPTVLPYNLQHSFNRVQAWLIQNDYKGRLADLIDYENLDQFPDSRSVILNGIEKRLSENGKTVFGDKSPNIHYFMPELLTILPNTKFIHIVRDGRAVALSRNKRAYKNMLLGGQEWVDSNALGLSNEALVGKNVYHIVKYEDLLSHPENTIRQICEFLKLDFELDMLAEQRQVDDNKSYVQSGFKKDKIDSFRTELSNSQLRKIERIQGSLLKKFGYEVNSDAFDKSYKEMSSIRRIWLNQGDSFRQLLVGRRIGMENRQNINVRVPISTRIKTFIFEFGKDFLPSIVFKRVFRKRWIKNVHLNK